MRLMGRPEGQMVVRGGTDEEDDSFMFPFGAVEGQV